MSMGSDASVLKEARRILNVMPKIAARMPKDLDTKRMTDAIKRFDDALTELVRINNERSGAVNQKNAAGKEVAEFIKRVRSTVKGVYGDDSDEYELVGGTRRSDRKPPKRKPKPAGG